MAKPGSTAGSLAEADRPLAARPLGPALPPEAPLDMPRQPVSAPRQRLRRQAQSWSARLGTAGSRVLVMLGTGALALYGVREMHGVMSSTSALTALQWVFLVVFAVNFAWVGFAAVQAVLGFVRTVVSDWAGLWPRKAQGAPPLSVSTALLAPVYNEDPDAVAARLAVMAEGLAQAQPGAFAIFILSDTNQPAAWIAEEAVFAKLIAAAPAGCPVYYRHRRSNAERKAGNIADWVTRWGGAYEAMLVLDADSIIAADTCVTLAGMMEADPGAGLIQTLPAIARGRTLYARLQQFANRCYGPIFGQGLAAWHGRSSNFWGHNAIIRVAAFAGAAKLPRLSGKPPFGGPVLSHDFIEAALLRRAGWGVRLAPGLTHTYEEAPPSLVDVMVRDRRWCQGNLQHVRFLLAGGLTLASRLHLGVGIKAYLSALLWFALVMIGVALAAQAALTPQEYFGAPSLFPNWPVFDTARALSLFAVSMAVVLTPKVLGWLAVMLSPKRLMAFGGPITVTVSVAVEAVLSALYAPIMMVAQTRIVASVVRGGDAGWSPQRRDNGGVPLGTALRAHWGAVVFGVGLTGLAYVITPTFALWLLPVTAGLMLAPVLSSASGSRALGGVLGWFGVLRTPEERKARRPAVLNALDTRLAEAGARPRAPTSALHALKGDPKLRAWRLAQIRTTPSDVVFDEAQILATAKLARAGDLAHLAHWLTRSETLALMHDAEAVAKLADLPDGETRH